MTTAEQVQEERRELRCAYCHDAAAGARACEGCGTLLHPGCLKESGGCPTLGCARAAPPRPAQVLVPGPRVVVNGVAPGHTAWWNAVERLLVAVIGAALIGVLFALLLPQRLGSGARMLTSLTMVMVGLAPVILYLASRWPAGVLDRAVSRLVRPAIALPPLNAGPVEWAAARALQRRRTWSRAANLALLLVSVAGVAAIFVAVGLLFLAVLAGG